MFAISKNKMQTVGVVVMMMALSMVGVLMETLNVEALMNTDQIFGYANILIMAFGGLVLLVVGFQLAKVVIRFVINLFGNFSL